MEGQLVRLTDLPSKGVTYPDDMELYVKPLSIREQMEMDRYGISQAEYYQILLDGITIRGNYNVNKLWFHDVQFMDIIRRLFTFDTEEEIVVSDYPCDDRYCTGKINYTFTVDQIQYTDFPEDIFGKEYTFSDGLTVVVEPLTILDFINLSKKYATNGANKNYSDTLLSYFTYCIKEVKDRTFKDDKHRTEFLTEYLGGLTKHKDQKLLRQIELDTVVDIIPFKAKCPECGAEIEVKVTPSSSFQQD